MHLYEGIKVVHVITALLSISLFVYRTQAKIQGKPIPGYMSYLPHMNDSLLLLLGVVMLVYADMNIPDLPWLQWKLFLVVVYILLGMYTLKWSATRQQRNIGFVAAIITFALVVLIAVRKYSV